MKVNGSIPPRVIGSNMLDEIGAASLSAMGDAAIGTASNALDVCFEWINNIE